MYIIRFYYSLLNVFNFMIKKFKSKKNTRTEYEIELNNRMTGWKINLEINSHNNYMY